MPDVTIRPADEFGINGDFIEAAAYAVLGEACLRSEALPASRPSQTRPVLGRIAQPPRRTGVSTAGR
jgi:1,6-anhydro-N-acetylmuramate kinase